MLIEVLTFPQANQRIFVHMLMRSLNYFELLDAAYVILIFTVNLCLFQIIRQI